MIKKRPQLTVRGFSERFKSIVNKIEKSIHQRWWFVLSKGFHDVANWEKNVHETSDDEREHIQKLHMSN